MTLPGRRLVNTAGFAACAGMMGFALFAQYGLKLDPCPLCTLQRLAVIGLGVVFLVAAIHDSKGFGRYVYAALAALVAAAGAGVAAWHVRMQNLPEDQLPACGPGLDYMLENFPLGEALGMVFSGSGECADVVWSFLGLSMPAWVFVLIVALGAAAVWNNVRQDSRAGVFR